jgi:osmotically-inducible protein OsmY/sporulation protein YlmC with PRC-barrel domain
MSTRYSERDYGRIDRDEPRGSQYGRGYDSDYERGYSGRGREGRGFTERAGDEVRSWFGDEDAERRRRMDEQRYGSGGYSSGYGRSGPESYYGRSYSGYGGERSSGENSILIRLSDTDFDVPDDQDIRGRTVIDQNGNEIGKIDDLLMDTQTRRVRFLQVTSGGFLGIGGKMLLIPVEAIARFDRNYVEIDQSMRGGLSAMRYNPPMIDKRSSGGMLSTFSGGFRGRGPRGYKRSDERIREDVNDRLSDDPLLDASGIDVVVNDGAVTLNGTVNNRLDRRRAEDIVLMVPGVTDVMVGLALLPYAAMPDVTETTTAARGAAAGTSGTTGTTGTRPRSTTT